MTDLDQMWSQMLAEALDSARSSGRHDVADYLDLRARNDALRQAGVRWLFEALIAFAGEANRLHTAIAIEREEPHNFQHRGANLAGTLLRFRHGVRCLTVEAGWTRTPADGFMRGGAMAVARITHFGMSKMNAELHLKPSADIPGWESVSPENPPAAADEHFLRRQFGLFLGEP